MPPIPRLKAMSDFPDFSQQGYQVERLLGQNSFAGRVTYLASNTNTQQSVVIKQFQRMRSPADESYQREVQVLQQLDHPNIPRYIDSFETQSSFCLIQEYKKAPSLAQPRHWTPEEIKQIAIAVLQVLMYLQKQFPPIIHRDIKPENILVDRQRELQVYLVDFGFAHQGGKEVAVSSVVKGTLGFMPPEQLFNRQLTKASDLYSLGVTLVCLLTGTKSTAVGNFIDEAYRIDFKVLASTLNPQFIVWLEKMTEPNFRHRYPNAAIALSALIPINVVSQLKIKERLVRFIPAIAVFIVLELIAVGLIDSFSKLFSVGNSSQSNSSKKSEKHEDTRRRLLETRECPNCNLSGTILVRVNLRGVNLENADLRSAALIGADLRGAILVEAKLEGAHLKNANLGSASLDSANLKGADLSTSNLTGADLSRANLENADLQNASLSSANLSGAKLMFANLSGAYARDTDLRGARLWDANLKGAILTNANLEGADLGNAALEGANLEGAQLRGAIMPDGKILSLE